jgi:hypothetical protein
MQFTMLVQIVQDYPVFSVGSFLFLYQPWRFHWFPLVVHHVLGSVWKPIGKWK